MRFLASFAILALGLVSKVAARAVPDTDSVDTVNMNAKLDVDFGSDAFDEYDKLKVRSAFALGPGPIVASATLDVVLGIVGQLNSSVQPHLAGIQSDLAQLQSDGEGDPMSNIAPQVAAIVSLTQQATAQVDTKVSIASDVEASPDADAPSLSDSLELVKSILELVSAIIGLVSSIAKISGSTASVAPIGGSLTNFTTSISSAVPGVQSLVASNSAAPALASQASALGYAQLASFLSGN